MIPLPQVPGGGYSLQPNNMISPYTAHFLCSSNCTCYLCLIGLWPKFQLTVYPLELPNFPPFQNYTLLASYGLRHSLSYVDELLAQRVEMV